MLNSLENFPLVFAPVLRERLAGENFSLTVEEIESSKLILETTILGRGLKGLGMVGVSLFL